LGSTGKTNRDTASTPVIPAMNQNSSALKWPAREGAIDAKKLGATQAELSEAILVAAALGAGASVTHGTHVIED